MPNENNYSAHGEYYRVHANNTMRDYRDYLDEFYELVNSLTTDEPRPKYEIDGQEVSEQEYRVINHVRKNSK